MIICCERGFFGLFSMTSEFRKKYSKDLKFSEESQKLQMQEDLIHLNRPKLVERKIMKETPKLSDNALNHYEMKRSIEKNFIRSKIGNPNDLEKENIFVDYINDQKILKMDYALNYIDDLKALEQVFKKPIISNISKASFNILPDPEDIDQL